MNQSEILKLRYLVTGYWISQAIYVVAKLGIPDLLAEVPLTSDEIAKRCETHPDSTYRLLRALAGEGLFCEEPSKTFRLTDLGRLLATDTPGSLRYYAIMMGEEQFTAWTGLLESVKTGESAFPKIYGEPFFPYLKAHPEAAHTFNSAMTSVSGRQIQAVTEAYDFSGIKTLADIGGGYGSLLAAILHKHPEMNGILYDLPEVIAGAKREMPPPERCELREGDFMQDVPRAEAYLLKYILHDWDDARAIKILKHCRTRIEPGGRLLVVEQVLPAANEKSFAKFGDLHMHVLLGGKERNEAEFRHIFHCAGFRLEKIVPTSYLICVLEGVPG